MLASKEGVHRNSFVTGERAVQSAVSISTWQLLQHVRDVNHLANGTQGKQTAVVPDVLVGWCIELWQIPQLMLQIGTQVIRKGVPQVCQVVDQICIVVENGRKQMAQLAAAGSHVNGLLQRQDPLVVMHCQPSLFGCLMERCH